MKKIREKFNPLVSIVIPVYNGENYVSEAINSTLKQTYKNIEIIVVDDGSKDNTKKICESYGNKIRYFRKENGGTSTALNLGIKNMRGEYFSWLSHDDMYYPDKIKREIEELAKLDNKNTIMMTDLDGIDENYEKIYETHYINHLNAYPLRKKSMIHPIIYNQTHGCTLLIPKKCFEEVGMFDETSFVAQDFEFFYRAFLVFPHKLIPEILVTARDSSNRQGRRSKVKGSVEYSDLFIKIIENLTDDDYKLLAPSKADFYEDMLDFFGGAGYNKAYNYIKNKTYKNLQISSNDLIGNKFNGHDLHFYIRKRGIISNQLVLNKESDDKNTYPYDFFSLYSARELMKNQLFYESDIIHFHLIHNIIDINYLPLITKLKPCVITLHDAFFFGGHCVHHFNCQKWKTHCQDCPYPNSLYPIERDYSSLNFEMKRLAIQNSQISVIVSSDWMLNKLKDSPIWKGKKIYKVPFGVDLTKFKPVNNYSEIREEMGIDVNNFVIMFRSDSGEFKGLDLIEESLLSIKTKKKISIITVGEENILDERIYNKFDVKEFGWVKDDNFLIKLYQCSDLFLMPSRQDTFGMMAVEAMACGKVVLATNNEGSAVPDIIKAPDVGISVNEEKFDATLKDLIEGKYDLKKLGVKSRNLVKEQYGLDKYIEAILNVYKDTMKNHIQDEHSKLVIEQLKKHMCREPHIYETLLQNKKGRKVEEDTIVVNSRKNSLKRIIYRQLPLKFRKNVKEYILQNDNKLNKSLRKHIIFDETVVKKGK